MTVKFFILFLTALLTSCAHQYDVVDPEKEYVEVTESKLINPSEPIIVDGVKITNLQFDLPVVINPAVEKWVTYFRTSGRNLFERYIERGSVYQKIITDILLSHGLPQDLYYVALIESGFNKGAVSHAAAVGPWQFIASTGKNYGLQMNYWVDERRDIVKATNAAARFFSDLYGQFGNWELATAAYNAGPAKINNAKRRYKSNDFWELRRTRYIRNETDNYVPKWMAAAIIDKNREAFGFDHVSNAQGRTWDEISLEKSIDLYELAQKLECTYAELRDLNPELRQWVTPPDTQYSLRVPAGLQDQTYAALEELYSNPKDESKTHTVKSGESAYDIAKTYGVSYSQLKRINNLSAKSLLEEGQTLTIPTSSASKLSQEEIRLRSNQYNSSDFFYVIRRGDSLGSIARKYRTTVSAIKKNNGLSSNYIYPGKRLKIPGKGNYAPPSNYVQRKNSQSNRTRPIDPRFKLENKTYVVEVQRGTAGSATIHVVGRGETISEIARKYDVSTKELKRVNSLKSNNLRLGQELIIPTDGKI